MNLKNMFARMVIACAIGAGTILVQASTATAASGDSGYVPAFTKIHQCAWVACGYWVTNYGTWFPFDCWKDAADYPGVFNSPTTRFFRISGNVGWVRASNVSSQPSLPRC